MLAATAFLIAFFGFIAEIRQIKITQGIQKYITEEWENRKEHNLPKEIEAYFMEHENPEDAESPTRLEAWASIIGATMYKGFKFGGMQAKSVDSKIQNRYDSQVREAIQDKMPPQYKIAKKVAEHLGFDFDDILEANEVIPFMKSLDKHGAGGMFTQAKNGGQTFNFKVE